MGYFASYLKLNSTRIDRDLFFKFLFLRKMQLDLTESAILYIPLEWKYILSLPTLKCRHLILNPEFFKRCVRSAVFCILVMVLIFYLLIYYAFILSIRKNRYGEICVLFYSGYRLSYIGQLVGGLNLL